MPDIVEIPGKTLVGIKMRMSVINNKTASLWGSFRPRLGEIKHSNITEFISLQEYDEKYFVKFDPAREFNKWALVEVPEITDVPKGMEVFHLPSGLYAVFHYKGLPGDPGIFQYIYGSWLPGSGYRLDNRPHFELLGPRYKNNSAESEEDLYIPIRSDG